jgi:hypothetical protein
MFQLPKSDNEDENEDNSFTELDTYVKRKGLETSFFYFVNLDSPPQTQHEVGQWS